MILDATVAGREVHVEVHGKDGRYAVVLAGRALDVDLRESPDGFASLLIDGRSYETAIERRGAGYAVGLPGGTLVVEWTEPSRPGAGGPAPHGGETAARVTAPMPGKMVRILVESGQAVQADQGLVVMEAMKMENELRSPRAGRVREVHVREGQAVETGALLVVVD